MSMLLLRTWAVSFAMAAAAAPPSPEPQAVSPRTPVHVDAKDLEKSMADAALGLVHGSGEEVRAAFDRAEKDCRRMTHAEDKIWIRDMVNQDMAMHAALDHARASASNGNLEDAMESMQWIVRTCRDCHRIRPK